MRTLSDSFLDLSIYFTFLLFIIFSFQHFLLLFTFLEVSRQQPCALTQRSRVPRTTSSPPYLQGLWSLTPSVSPNRVWTCQYPSEAPLINCCSRSIVAESLLCFAFMYPMVSCNSISFLSWLFGRASKKRPVSTSMPRFVSCTTNLLRPPSSHAFSEKDKVLWAEQEMLHLVDAHILQVTFHCISEDAFP